MSKSKKYYCKFCGALMVKGEVESYSARTGKPFYTWHCPRYLEWKAVNDTKWIANRDCPHYSYDEQRDIFYNHIYIMDF